MGACMSSGGIEVSEEDKRLHKEAEKSLKEVRLSIGIPCKESCTDMLYLGQSEDVKASKGITVQLP